MEHICVGKECNFYSFKKLEKYIFLKAYIMEKLTASPCMEIDIFNKSWSGKNYL